MVSPSSFSSRERQLRSRLHLLLNNAEGFIHGSLIEMARRCGNPNCRCASDDDLKHRSLYLGQTRGGKKSMVYLPSDLVPQVRQAAEHFQQALALLEELNDEARLRLDKDKSEGKCKRPAKKVAKKVAKKATRKKSPPPPKRS
jgi:hypothetical protein